jgi:diketogulonate reductase-like aldo/keto reductase
VKQRRFGPLDVECPVVGLGTWQLEADDRERAIRAIRRAIDVGMTHIDTAELYGDGEVESLIGEAIAGYRSDVFLTSKVHPDHATYTGTLLACEKSLRRLRTDRLDLYLLHWRGTLPLAETLRAFEALEREGKIRAFGVSNFDVADVEAAIEVVGEGRIACNQVLYHLGERDAEHVLHRICARHGIALVAYSPLGSGRFPRPGSFKGDVLASIAAAHGATPHAVALSFLLRQDLTFVIPKASRPEHVEALARAGDLELTAEDVDAIDGAFPLGPPRSKLPYL